MVPRKLDFFTISRSGQWIWFAPLGTSLEIEFEAVGRGEYQLAHRPSRIEALRKEQAFLSEIPRFETRLYERAAYLGYALRDAI